MLPASLAGALTATQLAQRLAVRSSNVTELLLAGVAINAFAAALLTLVISFADDQSLRGITFWLMGSLALADWPLASGLALVAVTGLALLWPRWRLLNALLLGERTASHAGFAVVRATHPGLADCDPRPWTISLTGGIGFIRPDRSSWCASSLAGITASCCRSRHSAVPCCWRWPTCWPGWR